MRSLRSVLTAIAFATLCFLTTIYMTVVGVTQTTQLVPNVTVTAVSSTAVTQIIAANPARKGLQICNVTSGGAIWIWPGATTVSAYVLAAMTSNVPVCWPSASVRFDSATGGNANGQAWSAEAAAANNLSVSVFEW